MKHFLLVFLMIKSFAVGAYTPPPSERSERWKQINWSLTCNQTTSVSGYGASFGRIVPWDTPMNCREAIKSAVESYMEERAYKMRSCESQGGILTCEGVERDRDANGRLTCEEVVEYDGVSTHLGHFMRNNCTCVCPETTAQVRPLFVPGSSSKVVEGYSTTNCEEAMGKANLLAKTIVNRELKWSRQMPLALNLKGLRHSIREGRDAEVTYGSCEETRHGLLKVALKIDSKFSINRLIMKKKETTRNEPVLLDEVRLPGLSRPVVITPN